jgi:type 1 glutamine amidotransferase
MSLRRFTSGIATLAIVCGWAGRAQAQGAGRATDLLDGRSLAGWQQAGAGRFVVEPGGSIVSEGGPGVLYYTRPLRDFALDLDYRADTPDAESGIFLRMPQAPTDPEQAAKAGYEVQIRDVATGPTPRQIPGRPARPARPDYNRVTGSITGFSAAWQPAAKPTGEWNHVRIEAAGQRYRVQVNGKTVEDFVGDRAREGLIGLENGGPDAKVHFRNVRVSTLPSAGAPATLGEALGGKPRGAAPIRVLVITATHGFRHTESIDASLEVLKAIEPSTEFQFQFSNDASAINAQTLAGVDVLFLDNSTLRAAPADPSDTAQVRLHQTARVAAPLTLAQQKAMVDFVRSGKGLASVHSGIDANYGWPEFREMMGGGLFRGHPWTQPGRIDVEDRANPAVSHFGDGFWIRDEMYVLDENPRPNSHVLLSLDMPSLGEPAGSQDHPMAFERRYGQGRVFVTVLGHFGDNWHRPDFVQMVLQGLRIAAGRLPADFTAGK